MDRILGITISLNLQIQYSNKINKISLLSPYIK